MPTTYTKLKNGSWGIRVESAMVPCPGPISVTKKDGTSKNEVLDKVIWSGNGVHLCTLVPRFNPEKAPNRNRPPMGKIECDECGDFVSPGSKCWETGARHG